MKTAKQTKQKIRRLFRGSLTLAMAFVVATSTVATAYATYQTLVPVKDNQTVTVEHIWVDNGNKDNTRPDEVKADVTAKDNNKEGDDKSVDLAPDDGNGNPQGEYKEKDTITDDGTTAGKEAGEIAAEKDLESLNPPKDTPPVVIPPEGGTPGGENTETPADKTLKPINPGKDDGFKDGFADGYLDAVDEANKDKAEEDKIKVEGMERPQKPSEGEETKPDEGGETEPPKASQDPLGKDVLDPNVAAAITDILKDKPVDNIVTDLSGKTDKVDKVISELNKKDENGVRENHGDVWHESEDYVANVENKDGVRYEVELPQETKEALKDSGYDSVQLKITYEALYNILRSGEGIVTDKDTNEEVLVKRTFVSYDGVNFKSTGVAMKSADGGKTWTPYNPTKDYVDGVDEKASEHGREDIETILAKDYDPEADYINETTYTFMHVLNYKEPEPEKTSVSVNKVWNDQDDKDGIRPTSVTIQLVQNEVAQSQKVVLNKDNGWTGKFSDLDLKDKNGNLYVYTVQEVDVANGYTPKVEPNNTGDTIGFTVTNTHKPSNTSGNNGGGDDDDDDDPTPPPTPTTYVEIPDEPVPMSATPRLLENYIEILDEDVPLAGLPSEPGTGAVSHRSLWATILIASLGGLLILLHKDEEEAA